MAEIVNLRRVRKARDRAAQSAAADANRLAFGRRKSETQLSEARAEQAERRLDGHERERPGDDA